MRNRVYYLQRKEKHVSAFNRIRIPRNCYIKRQGPYVPSPPPPRIRSESRNPKKLSFCLSAIFRPDSSPLPVLCQAPEERAVVCVCGMLPSSVAGFSQARRHGFHIFAVCSSGKPAGSCPTKLGISQFTL